MRLGPINIPVLDSVQLSSCAADTLPLILKCEYPDIAPPVGVILYGIM